MTRALSPTLLALAVCGSALAATPIDEKRAVAADAHVEISNVKGSVTVSGWDRNEVAVSGTLGDGAKPLKIEGSDADVRIKVEGDGKQGWFSWGSDSRMGPTDLDVKVPRSAALKIEVVSANVSLSGVDGASLDVDSVSGKLRLDSGAGEVDIDSVSGNVDLVGKSAKAHVETVSGSIRTRGLGGKIKYETVSGDIDADNGTYREIDASTVSGDIKLRGKPAPDATVGVESMSGNVHLYLPDDASARLKASSFSGTIRSDFGTVKEPEHGPGSSLDASVGSGSGQVKIETFSGDVDIRRQ